MAPQYYYEVTSLPMLRFGEPPGIDVETFNDFCRQRLPSTASAVLGAVSLVPDRVPCCTVDRDWQAWETYLRNCLVRRRAEAAEVAASDWMRPDLDVFPGVRRRLEEIMSEGDPLSRQRELDSLRWGRLDDLSVGHPFDLAALLLYKLKLLIACRLDAVSTEEGRRRHDAIVDSGLEQAAEARVPTGLATET